MLFVRRVGFLDIKVHTDVKVLCFYLVVYFLFFFPFLSLFFSFLFSFLLSLVFPFLLRNEFFFFSTYMKCSRKDPGAGRYIYIYIYDQAQQMRGISSTLVA